MKSERIWFWQRIISPHMASLAAALVERGCEVTYVVEREMSPQREKQGWSVPVMPGVNVVIAASKTLMTELVKTAPQDSIHICQGIRANGLVSYAQYALRKHQLQQWVVMETVDDSGWRGVLKRFYYRTLLFAARSWLEGVLATGHATADWVLKRGMARTKVIPFAYFLPVITSAEKVVQSPKGLFRFIFVGQFIERKRLDLLIRALASLSNFRFEFVVVGSGPLEAELYGQAIAVLGNRLRWIGRLPAEEVSKAIAQADCLVLPSRHDGWGAVVSEALMVGTPAICSDRCGSAGAVRASGLGGVFPSGDLGRLQELLHECISSDKIQPEERRHLASWARCLGAEAGASYLLNILRYKESGIHQLLPPRSRSNYPHLIECN